METLILNGPLLIVDDTAVLRGIYATMLKRRYKDINIEYAEDGREALNKVRSSDYSIIISDINMPVMNGIEFYKHLKEISPHLADKVIFISGSKDHMKFIEGEGIPFLLKPFKNREFIHFIDAKLNHKRRG